MKKTILIASFFFIGFSLCAQYYCDEGRFTSEVFTPNEVKITRNVQYATNFTLQGVSRDLLFDFFEPNNDPLPERPLIILAHGGSFVYGSKTDMENDCKLFTQRGYACASINYRLWNFIAGGTPDSNQYISLVIRGSHDMKAAVRFFRKDAATSNTFKIDPDNIFVGGYSAGSFCALNVAYLTDTTSLPQIIIDSLQANGGIEGSSGNDGYSSSVKGVLNIAGALYRASMLNDPSAPAIFSLHGDNDGTVPYGSDFAKNPIGGNIVRVEGSSVIHQQAQSIGVNSTLKTIAGGGHGTPIISIGDPNWRDTSLIYMTNLMSSFICSPLYTNNIISDKKDFSLYPNPTSGNVNIVNNFSENGMLSIYNNLGQVVFSQTMNASVATVNLSNLTKGLYIYQFKSEDKMHSGKIIIDN